MGNDLVFRVLVVVLGTVPIILAAIAVFMREPPLIYLNDAVAAGRLLHGEALHDARSAMVIPCGRLVDGSGGFGPARIHNLVRLFSASQARRFAPG